MADEQQTSERAEGDVRPTTPTPPPPAPQTTIARPTESEPAAPKPERSVPRADPGVVQDVLSGEYGDLDEDLHGVKKNLRQAGHNVLRVLAEVNRQRSAA